MKSYRTVTLESEFEVIDVLDRLFKETGLTDMEDCLDTEWDIINSSILDVLSLRGVEGWDFVLMDWPAEVAIFNCTINNHVLAKDLEVDELVSFLRTLRLSWCVRIESLDRIQKGVMVGGQKISDIVVTRDVAYVFRHAR